MRRSVRSSQARRLPDLVPKVAAADLKIDQQTMRELGSLKQKSTNVWEFIYEKLILDLDVERNGTVTGAHRFVEFSRLHLNRPGDI